MRWNQPMFRVIPIRTSSSIARQVSDRGTWSISIFGLGEVGSKTQLGGYLSSNGTNFIEMGKCTRYRSKYWILRSRRLRFAAENTCSSLWYVFHSLDVMKRSSLVTMPSFMALVIPARRVQYRVKNDSRNINIVWVCGLTKTNFELISIITGTVKVTHSNFNGWINDICTNLFRNFP